jgi:hypothetical protein
MSQVVSKPFEVEIVKALELGPQRRSQVVLVRIMDPDHLSSVATEKCFVAKCYDPLSHGSQVESGGTAEEYCANGALDEARAYAALAELQGTEIPIFYGKYQTRNMADNLISAILLEEVKLPTLADFKPTDFTEEDQAAILEGGLALLKKLYVHGVFHMDMDERHFFRGPMNQLKLFDFDQVVILKEDAKPEVVRRGRIHQRNEFAGVLRNCGLPDPIATDPNFLVRED